MTISNVIINEVHRYAEVAVAQIRAGIDQAITETIEAGVEHAEIHVWEWFDVDEEHAKVKAVIRPLAVDDGGIVICYHRYGKKPEEDR